jgi:WD40 repeat protein
MAFDPHGTSLVTSSRDDTVKLWSLSPESLQREKKIATFLRDLSAENKYGGNDYRYPYHDNPVTSIAFNPQGDLMATGSEDGTVWIWQVNSLSGAYTPIVRLPDHTKQVTSVTFSADGKRLASIAADNNVRIWDMSRITEYLAVRKEVDRIYEANKFSPGVSPNAEALGIPELVQKLELFLKHHSNNRATLKRR